MGGRPGEPPTRETPTGSYQCCETDALRFFRLATGRYRPQSAIRQPFRPRRDARAILLALVPGDAGQFEMIGTAIASAT